MLTHWDTLSVPSGPGVQKVEVDPVSKKGSGDHRVEPTRDRTASEGEGTCVLSVNTYRDFLFPHVRETELL